MADFDVAAAAITGVPCYADPDNAARSLGHAVRYRAWRGQQRGKVPELEGLRAADARTVVTGFLAGSLDGDWLPEASVADLLSCYGVPLVATKAAASEQEAVAAAAQLGGPVVLKAEAEGLVHRTDAGAVRVDLRTPGEVAEGYRTLAAGFGPRLQRVLVQPMLAGGVEVMINSVRAAPLMAGRRGTPPVDTAGSRMRCCGSPGSLMISRRSASWILIPSSPGRTASGVWTCGCGSARQSPGIPSCAGCCEHAAAHGQPAVRGRPYRDHSLGARAGLVLAAALSGLRPGQAPRDYYPHSPAESLSAFSRRRGQLIARRSSRSGRYPGGGPAPLGMSVE